MIGTSEGLRKPRPSSMAGGQTYAAICADSSSPISLIELMNIDMKTLFGKIAAPSGLLKTAPHLMDTDGHRFFVFSIENPSVFIRVHLTRRQPSGRPKKNTCIHYLKKLSTFSFALLALCFALSCSSSTSQIKSKPSLNPSPMRNLSWVSLGRSWPKGARRVSLRS